MNEAENGLCDFSWGKFYAGPAPSRNNLALGEDPGCEVNFLDAVEATSVVKYPTVLESLFRRVCQILGALVKLYMSLLLLVYHESAIWLMRF